MANKLRDGAWTPRLADETKYSHPKLGERDLRFSYFPVERPAGVDRGAAVSIATTERKCAENDLRRLPGRILDLQEGERRRIAGDLHDDLGQALFAAKLTLDRVCAHLWKLGHLGKSQHSVGHAGIGLKASLRSFKIHFERPMREGR
jgi:glucose-6-phosphate-specific signal transduction histidine kinase